MSHHKRGRPKQSRAGCLFCKPYKGNGTKGMKSQQTIHELRARISEKEQLTESWPSGKAPDLKSDKA